jgi:3D (Asp-Asp-Asp) domain-containing protein
MTRPIQIAILPALAAALFFSLAALASQRDAMSELKRVSQNEYRAEVAQLVVSDPEYLRRLEGQSRPNALVTVTAYNADQAQTDSDPDIAASMRRVRPGTIAVSRDLFDRGWVFGRKVRLEGIGIYEINDLMAPRHSHAIDIFIHSNSQALAFGKRRIKAALLSI